MLHLSLLLLHLSLLLLHLSLLPHHLSLSHHQSLLLHQSFPLHLSLVLLPLPVLPHLKLDQDQLLNPKLLLKLEQLPLLDLLPELEPTPRPLPQTAVTESRKPMNNVKVEIVAHIDANSTRPTDLVDSDLQELLLLVPRNDDAMDSEFADQPSSNKTQRRNVSKPMVPKVFATSPLESAINFFFCYHLDPVFKIWESSI